MKQSIEKVKMKYTIPSVRSISVSTKVYKEEHAIITVAADTAGKTVAAYVRELVLQHTQLSTEDLDKVAEIMNRPVLQPPATGDSMACLDLE